MDTEQTLDTNVDTTAPIETTQTEQTQQTTQVSSYENEAREMGWRPKDVWEGDPDKWRDAKEFVERGELYGKIDSVSRELKETRKALKMLQEHHSKVKEIEFKRAVDELKAAQKKHLEEGNADGYLETTELLTELKAEQKAREVVEESVPKTHPGVDPRFTAWTKENVWYDTDRDMRDFADTIGQGFAARNPGINPVEVLKYVTREVKKHYKEKFENPNRSKPGMVEDKGTNTQSTTKKDSVTLSDDERRVMNTFLRQGIMTKEGYLEQVKAMRGNQ